MEPRGGVRGGASEGSETVGVLELQQGRRSVGEICAVVAVHHQIGIPASRHHFHTVGRILTVFW